MQPAAAIERLGAVFRNPRESAVAFLGEGLETARSVFLRWHLPLLLLYPVAIWLCPLTWIFSGGPSWKSALAPLGLALGSLALAFALDRTVQYSVEPRVRTPEESEPRNVAFFLFLPVSGAGLFFLIHPAVGYLALFAAALFSLYNSLETLAWMYSRSRARILTDLIVAVTLLLLPLLVFFGLLNLLNSVRILREFI